jgi:hypothetical protein
MKSERVLVARPSRSGVTKGISASFLEKKISADSFHLGGPGGPQVRNQTAWARIAIAVLMLGQIQIQFH